MSQHDYTIANQGFPATRADINNALSAIATNNSGTSAPSTQYAGQFWIDTTSSTWILYMHDGTDDIQFAQIDTSANTVNFIDSTVNADLLNDTSPQLGGNLDLNSNDITGTGNINITGTIESSGNITGTLATASQPNITSVGTLTNSGATVTTFNRTGSDGDILEFQNDGTTVGSIGTPQSGIIYIQSEGDRSGFQFGTSNIYPRKNNALSDNTVDVGSSVYRYNDLYLGGGAFLGGTGTANKLDDYEEGTFTPVLQGSSSNPTSVTYSNQVGKYTKVGNKVTVNYYLETNGYSGGSGVLELDGLPFTVASPTYNWSVGSLTFYQVAQFNETVARANANTTYLTVWGRDTLTTSGTWGNKNLSDWRSSGISAVMATVTYFTD